MTNNNASCEIPGCESLSSMIATRLNEDCFCQTLDRERLDYVLRHDQLQGDVLAQHPQLFSNIATFVSRTQFTSIKNAIEAIERTIALPAFNDSVMHEAHSHARVNHGPKGAFMGYDFHLSTDGARLIEINTNAGGAFLNAILVGAQKACCPPMEDALHSQTQKLFDDFVSMFRNEWQLQRGDKPLRRIAIIDHNPESQFLYPEFVVAQRLFNSHGIDAIIVDPQELAYENQVLSHLGQPIDLVYNRLTDFYLTDPINIALLNAYLSGDVVVTPNPYHHALYADKRHLIILSDRSTLDALGCNADDARTLIDSIPSTISVTTENASELWSGRKGLFFKPACGYGSKATYRGDKLTTKVWRDIVAGNYVAQTSVWPSERAILLDGVESALKMDIRAYSYDGKIQLLAARLYQGQTTNFRTRGGGFAPVFIL